MNSGKRSWCLDYHGWMHALKRVKNNSVDFDHLEDGAFGRWSCHQLSMFYGRKNIKALVLDKTFSGILLATQTETCMCKLVSEIQGKVQTRNIYLGINNIQMLLKIMRVNEIIKGGGCQQGKGKFKDKTLGYSNDCFSYFNYFKLFLTLDF